MDDATREVIIIGSGPAGYTAAIYAARADLKPLMIAGDQPGGQLMLTSDVENWPGEADGVMGPDLMLKLKKQSVRFGTEFVQDMVTEVDFDARPFVIKTKDKISCGDGDYFNGGECDVAWDSGGGAIAREGSECLCDV